MRVQLNLRVWPEATHLINEPRKFWIPAPVLFLVIGQDDLAVSLFVCRLPRQIFEVCSGSIFLFH